MRIRQLILINLAVWLFCALVVGASWLINRNAIQGTALSVFQAQGRAAFTLIRATRHWNAAQGSVYVPVSSLTPPNPYLELENRDITDNLGRRLTQVNPAYMTRQISDLLADADVNMRITSRNPVNPMNRADSWESESLGLMEQTGATEHVDRVGDQYRYMARLDIVHSCLPCHEQQGYKVGDLRGGISFTRSAAHVDPLVNDMLARVDRIHLGIWVLISMIAGLTTSLVFRFRQQLVGSESVQQALRALVETDSLTGVLSRRELMNRLHREVDRCNRFDTSLVVLMVDIDHFKQVNDHYGHAEGDRILKRVAERLQASLRRVDSLGRYGGEEFTIILPRTSHDEALILARRLLEQVELMGDVTISVGMACSRDLPDPVTGDVLLKMSDQALYAAKRNGRNRVFCHRELS